MERIYDDYKFKNLNYRVEVNFDRKISEPLSTWEVSKFVGRFNTCYYKIELVNTIAIAINNGIKPENIVMLDKAFKVNERYENFNTIDLKNDGVSDMYSIGNPISIFPNDDITQINFLFKLFKKLNKKLYETSNQRLTKDDHKKYYNKLINNNFNEAVEWLCKRTKLKIKNEESEVEIKNYIDESKNITFQQYNKYTKDKISFQYLSEIIASNNLNEVDKSYKILISKYYSRFFNLITKLPRPIVGIYNKDTNQIDILCRAHINIKERNQTFLDLKEISHHSPLKALFEAGLDIYSTIKDEGRKKEIHEYEIEIKRLEKIKLEKEINNLEIDQEIAKIKKYNLLLYTHKKLDELTDDQEKVGIKNITNQYISSQLNQIYKNTQENVNAMINENQFKIENEKIHLIDVKV